MTESVPNRRLEGPISELDALAFELHRREVGERRVVPGDVVDRCEDRVFRSRAVTALLVSFPALISRTSPARPS